MHDPALAIEELKRSKAMGHVGANIPCVPPPNAPYSDPMYENFWNAAEELEMPLVMHFLTSTQPNHGLPEGMAMGTGYGLAAFAMQRVIVDIIGGGVCARHPKLKFIITEWETGWIAHFLQRMDWAFHAHYRNKPEELTESFSHYWHQNFVGTSRRPRRPRYALRRRRAQPHVGQRLPPPRLDLPAQQGRPGRHLRRHPGRGPLLDHLRQRPRVLPPANRGVANSRIRWYPGGGRIARCAPSLCSECMLCSSACPGMPHS